MALKRLKVSDKIMHTDDFCSEWRWADGWRGWGGGVSIEFPFLLATILGHFMCQPTSSLNQFVYPVLDSEHFH